MHKHESSEFGKIGRAFVSAGGTLICLAHTNKYRSADGDPMYVGTSDINYYFDCVYILDKLEGHMTGNDAAIEFMNKKARCDVADKVSFSYSKEFWAEL